MLKKTHEHEFLPAALEIQESPPSPMGRLIVWSLVLLVIIAIAWASIGEVDVVATAQGKIIASGHSKIIQPLEIGVVKSIHVSEGQRVAKGDLLIELDGTSSGADKRRIEAELLDARMDKQRLDVAVNNLGDPDGLPAQLNKLTYDTLSGITAGAKLLQQQRLRSQLEEHNARLQTVNASIAQRQAELSATRTRIKKLEATLPIITERVVSLKALLEKNLASRHDYLALEQQRREQYYDLISLKDSVKQIRAAITGAKQQKQTLQAEYRKNILGELAETQRKIAALSQELNKTRQRVTLQKLTAPVSGVVQQIAIHTVGGVVTPAQSLMVIVPERSQLEVEAWLANKDIGFVNEGQQAEIKVETFPFTKYGVIDAEIASVSNDAIVDEKNGLVYRARVLMKKSAIQVGDKLVNLAPGMAVTVEVKTGKRRLIDYFLSPLMEYTTESIRER
ncbi:MAG TPA: HlyD family type I secretion periplasmic adaptor subunit [Gammaproteobacteria bacterium]|nr:HlyD family type I secretion periplasmic adaptor subunit [Gammaproteobacteria bacterium]